MSPCLPEDIISSVTIIFTGKTLNNNDSLMFGISKHHFAERKNLGDMIYDWSIDLTNGEKQNSKASNPYDLE